MQVSDRSVLRWSLIVTVIAATHGITSAQHHHHHHGDDNAGDDSQKDAEPTLHVTAGVGVETGKVEAFAATRTYQGMMVMLDVRRGRFEAGAHVPLYRIDLGGATEHGLGDIHVEGRWVAHERGTTQIGLVAGAMPPFGDDTNGLGMGHWMIMAGGFARAARGRISGSLGLGYGGAIGGGGHEEHGVLVWPPVSPMNAQEAQAKLGVQVAVWNKVGVSASLNAAAPLGDGEFIATAGGDVSYQLGRAMLSVGARHGLASHTAGLVVTGHVMTSF